MENYAALFSGLGVLLFGTKLLEKSFYRISSLKQRTLFEKITKLKIFQVILGIVLSFLTGNSQIAIIITIAAISGKLLSLKQSVGIILGANLGAIINYIFFKNALYFVMPIFILVGILIELTTNDKKIKNFSNLLISVSMIYLGFNILRFKTSFFTSNLLINEIVSKTENPLAAYLVGILGGFNILDIGGVLYSSNELFFKSAADYRILISFLIGLNLSKSFIPLICSIELDRISKKAAGINFLFNFLSGIVVLLLVNYFKDIILNMNLEFEESVIAAMFVINISTVVLQYLYTDFLISFMTNKFSKNKTSEETASKYLNENLIFNKNKSTEALKNETTHIFSIVSNNLILIKDVYFNESFFLSDKIEKNEKMIDVLSRDIIDFSIKAARSNEKTFEEKFNSYVYIAGDIEKIGDHIVEILKTCFLYQDRTNYYEKRISEIENLFNLTMEAVNKTQNIIMENHGNENFDELFLMQKKFENLDSKIKNYAFENNGNSNIEQRIFILDSTEDLMSIYERCKNIAKYLIKM